MSWLGQSRLLQLSSSSSPFMTSNNILDLNQTKIANMVIQASISLILSQRKPKRTEVKIHPPILLPSN